MRYLYIFSDLFHLFSRTAKFESFYVPVKITKGDISYGYFSKAGDGCQLCVYG